MNVIVIPSVPALFPYPRSEWTVAESFGVVWKRPDRETVSFTIAAGFRTDLASIPRPLRLFVSRFGRHRVPSIIHDWCYEAHTKLTRSESDELFLLLMDRYGVPRWKRQAMYRAVRVFGASRWGPSDGKD